MASPSPSLPRPLPTASLLPLLLRPPEDRHGQQCTLSLPLGNDLAPWEPCSISPTWRSPAELAIVHDRRRVRSVMIESPARHRCGKTSTATSSSEKISNLIIPACPVKKRRR
jgi:hypothetical protein